MLKIQTVRTTPTGDALEVIIQTTPPSNLVSKPGPSLLRWIGAVAHVVFESSDTWGAYVSEVRTNFGKGAVEVVSLVPADKEPAEVEAQIQQALADAPTAAWRIALRTLLEAEGAN